MAMIDVQVTEQSQRAVRVRLDAHRAGVARGLSAGINAATIHLASVIKRDYLSGQLVNRRTGNLSRAVFSKMVDATTGVVGVGAEAPYARFINDGTAPHVITAHGAIVAAAGRAGLDVKGISGPRALRFVMNGQVMFRQSVMHPGIRARHFMETALEAAMPDIQRIVAQRVNAAVMGRES